MKLSLGEDAGAHPALPQTPESLGLLGCDTGGVMAAEKGFKVGFSSCMVKYNQGSLKTSFLPS